MSDTVYKAKSSLLIVTKTATNAGSDSWTFHCMIMFAPSFSHHVKGRLRPLLAGVFRVWWDDVRWCKCSSVYFSLHVQTCERWTNCRSPLISVSLWRCAFLHPRHLPENRISVLQLAQRVKEIEVSMGKRRSAAQRALCGRFPSSALVFSLSKVTLKATRHAGNPAYLFKMQTFVEPISAVLCYFRSLPLQRNKLGRRPTHYRSKLWFHI